MPEKNAVQEEAKPAATAPDIVIVGVGVICALPGDTQEAWQSLCGSKSGISQAPHPGIESTAPLAQIGRSNKELAAGLALDPEKTYSRTALLGMVAAKEALEDAGMPQMQDTAQAQAQTTDPERQPSRKRTALISGTSVGGMDLSEKYFNQEYAGSRPHLRLLFEHDCGASTMRIADYLGLRGTIATISTACSSAANAIMYGARLLQDNRADIVVAGGTDSLCNFTVNGFASLHILSQEQCRPFDATRQGLNLGEGAGYVVLMRKEDAEETGRRVYCRLSGWANRNDAYHQTATSPEGLGPELAMRAALKMARLKPEEIDYVNAHGTATPNNDLSEGVAMRKIFGDKVPAFGSMKSQIGHTLGACGGIESVFCALMIKEQKLPPQLHFGQPMPETGLSPQTTVKEDAEVKNILSNAFGFGGNMASLVFSKG